MTLNGVMAVTLRYFNEFGKPALQKTICGGIYAKVLYFLVRVQCRRKGSARSLSHPLMSFLLCYVAATSFQLSGVKNVAKFCQSLLALWVVYSIVQYT